MNMDDHVQLVYLHTHYNEHWARLDQQVHPITQIPVWEYVGSRTAPLLRDQIHDAVYLQWAQQNVPDPH